MTAIVPRRRLGPQGPEVPVLGLGSWNTWDRMPEHAAAEVLDLALRAGASLFDVAHYDFGPHKENARTDLIWADLVRAASVQREAITVCGKLWLWEYPALNFQRQIDTALGRAGLDRYDLLVVGDCMVRPDVAAIVDGVNALIRQGLVAGWGVNNWHIDDTRAALEHAARTGQVGPGFAQLKYGIARRAMAEGPGYGPLFAQGLMGLQASDVLEGGLLAGKGAPQRKIGHDVGGIRDRIAAMVPELGEIAERFGTGRVPLALAWCLAAPQVAGVLVGVSSPAQLRENLSAFALAQAHGPAIRAACEGLRCDDGVAWDGS